MQQVTNDTDGKQVYCYDVHVNGIFGRNRKPKREMFTLAKHLDSPLTIEQALSLMDAKLASLKFKGAYTSRLTERIGRLKNEQGFQVYTTDLFGGSKVLVEGTANLEAITIRETKGA